MPTSYTHKEVEWRAVSRAARPVLRHSLRAIRVARFLLKSWRIQRKWRAMEAEDGFDVTHGTETTRQSLRLNYAATPMRTFQNVIRAVPAPLDEFAFIDLGSGKGRALLLASDYPFKKIVGVERSRELHVVAQQNIAGYLERAGKPDRFELRCEDAVNYIGASWPEDDAVVFMYCPFPASVLEDVCRGIRRQLSRHGRRIIIAFVNPNARMARVLEEWKGLRSLVRSESRDPDLAVYESFEIFSVDSRKETRAESALPAKPSDGGTALPRGLPIVSDPGLHHAHRDMQILDGEILPVTLRLALPILVGSLSQFLYTVADTFFIARIDAGATEFLNGTGLVFPIFSLFVALATGIGAGVSALVARGIGEQNPEIVRATADSASLLSTALACTALVAGYVFGSDILSSLSGSKLSPETLRIGLGYLHYLLPGLAIMLFAYTLVGVLQGAGLTRNLATAMLVATFINVVLDPLLIFGLEMGVAGAALATTISITFTAVYLVAISSRHGLSVTPQWNLLNARRRVIGEIARIGCSRTLALLSLSFGFMCLNKLVSSISEVAMNAWTLCGRLDQFILIPAIAIGIATTAMVGQNYGANELKRVLIIYRSHILYGLVTVLAAVLAYNLGAGSLFDLFSARPEVVEAAVLQVRYLSFTFLGIVTAVISCATFQSTGHPLPSILIQLVRIGAVVVPTAYVLVTLFDMGIHGVYLAIAIGNIAVMAVSWFWTNHHLKNLRHQPVMV